MCFKLQPTYFTIDSTVTRYTLTLVSIELISTSSFMLTRCTRTFIDILQTKYVLLSLLNKIA